MKILRPHQVKLKADVYQGWAEGHRNVLAVLATGGGKTLTFSDLLREQNLPSCVVAHRQELVSQISCSLAEMGVWHRIIGPKKIRQFCISEQVKKIGRSFIHDNAIVAVAGIDTLIRRGDELKQWLNSVRIWVIDEAHHVLRDNKWGKGVAMFPNAFGLGVTATPVRADKKSLGRKRSGVFDKLVEGPAMRWLIEQGYLCKYRVAGIKPSYIMDDSEIAENGDYSFEKLRKKAHASRIVGDIVDSYLDIAPGKLGLTFTVDVELAKDTAAAYRQKGVPAEALSGDTPDHIRVFHMERFRRGELKQLTNVDLFGEGLDVPGVEVVSDGRRTQSFGRYCQVFGRMLRPAEGKTHGIYIDHVGNAIQHKMPDRPRIWSLDDEEKGKKSKSPDDAIPLRSCVACLWPYEAIYKCCPYCGHKPEPLSRSAPEHVDGDVTEYSEEFLQLLRGEISKANTLWSGTVNNVQQASMRKNMEIAHEVSEELKTCIAYWAGIERDAGLTDSQAYRKFYFIHGIDVMKAQMLDTADKRKIIGKIREEWT